MSRATREQVYSALFAKLQGISGLTTVSRRLANIQDVQPENFPAAYQIQEKQSAKYQGSVPTRTVLRASWLFYSYDSDPNGAPSIGLNNLVDQACAALAPPSVMQKNTLGGLVEYAAIDGDIEIFEGVLGDRAIAIVPIEIVLAGF
jgi:hypothetical protein